MALASQAKGLTQASPGQSESASAALGVSHFRIDRPNGATQMGDAGCSAPLGRGTVVPPSPRATLAWEARSALGWLAMRRPCESNCSTLSEAALPPVVVTSTSPCDVSAISPGGPSPHADVFAQTT